MEAHLAEMRDAIHRFGERPDIHLSWTRFSRVEKVEDVREFQAKKGGSR